MIRKGNRQKLNFILPLVVYPFDIMFSFGETNEELDVHFDKFGITSDDCEYATFGKDTVEGRTVLFTGGQTLIRLKKIPTSARDFATMQHEIFHAVTFILNRVGMKLSLKKSDEAYAYLIGYITEKCYDKIFSKR